MKSNYKKLGEYIREVNIRNTDLRLSTLLGVSVTKEFIPSIANTVGTDFTKYKIVKRNQFTYIPDTSRRGDKIGVALLQDYDEALVSQAYTVFEVTDEDKLNPEYLMMWFRRPEFDRYARFKSEGSVREIFSWNEMCNIELPVPDIEKQRKIVEQYNQINKAIQIKEAINNNLEQQAFSFYKLKISNKDKNAVLSDIANITMGTSPEGESYNDIGNGIIFYQGRSDFGFRLPTVRLYTTEPKKYANKGDILMSVRAPVGDINIAKEKCSIGRGLAAINSKIGCASFLFYTMLELKFELNKFNDEGTVFGSITKDDLFALPIVSLTDDEQKEFEDKIAPMDKQIYTNEKEILMLKNMQSLLLKKLTAKTAKLSFIITKIIYIILKLFKIIRCFMISCKFIFCPIS